MERELRIGNYVNINGEIVKIDIKLFHAIIHGFTGYNPDPIPLTKEWLFKFGFVCHSDGYCHLPSKGISFNDYKSNMINLCVGKYCQEGEDLPHIKHVHQLQNLYFALTGEELKING